MLNKKTRRTCFPHGNFIKNDTTQGIGSAITGEIQWKWWSEGNSQTVGCRAPQ